MNNNKLYLSLIMSMVLWLLVTSIMISNYVQHTSTKVMETPSITSTRLMRIEVDCVKPGMYELDSKEYLMCIRDTIWSDLNKQVVKDE